MKRLVIAALIAGIGIASASAGGFMLLHVGPADSGGAVAGCASPTAPNGAVDLSQCSNAFYVAVIF
jgi:hypothetical protein